MIIKDLRTKLIEWQKVQITVSGVMGNANGSAADENVRKKALITAETLETVIRMIDGE
jgi:hypothetical protein